jgi:large subunit ribosomal protein L35
LAKETRLKSMRKHLHDLIILADINDPIVKRKFEDGQGTSDGCCEGSKS